MKASQAILNEETTEQQAPVSRWKCNCVFHRLFVLVFLKLVMNLGLLESLILCLRFVMDVPRPGFLIVLISLAIFTDIVDIVTGLGIILSVCMKRQRLMEIYYKYSIYIFGSLTILCCLILFLVLPTLDPVLALLLMLVLVLFMQAYLNYLVKSKVLKLRSKERHPV